MMKDASCTSVRVIRLCPEIVGYEINVYDKYSNHFEHVLATVIDQYCRCSKKTQNIAISCFRNIIANGLKHH